MNLKIRHNSDKQASQSLIFKLQSFLQIEAALQVSEKRVFLKIAVLKVSRQNLPLKSLNNTYGEFNF